MAKSARPFLPHSAHWGAFYARSGEQGIDIVPHPADPAPSPLLGNLPDTLNPDCRIRTPAVRRGWLEDGPGPTDRRGKDEFVALGWNEALDLAAGELRRVQQSHGPQAIYGGSYGWSSAGRFHHAQSQVHRFLNTALGGYTRSVGNYSAGAAQVIVPHVLGPLDATNRWSDVWGQVEANTELVVAFGGMAIKNSSVSSGGVLHHSVPGRLRTLVERGAQFVLFSPQLSDLPPGIKSEWLSLRPATDTAIMLGLAHTLWSENLHDVAFLDRYCVGFDQFADYLAGTKDGIAKTADWAAAISEVDADVIRNLARRMARCRTLITTSQSLQRAEHGEQPIWMAITLAAMLGQMGLPGGGFVYGLGSMANVGKPPLAVRLPTLPQGRNGIADFIPVARVADMLLDPGGKVDYDGQTLTYPDIRLVYWAGGNPFHHHQHLARLEQAFGRPDTVIVNEAYWTATARRADIVFPATTTMERDDIGASANDPLMIAMRRVAPPAGEARDEFDIFTELAERLETREAFTEGRTARQWLSHIYEQSRESLAGLGYEAPDFEQFWAGQEMPLPVAADRISPIDAFRADPVASPLPTPSGKIEITSATLAGFGYDDCGPHARWIEPDEWLGAELAGRFPLQLISNQPATRLHSQHDFGAVSQASKIAGREPLTMNRADAAARGLDAGDIVRVFNERGAFLAGLLVSDDIRPGVVQIATGAWYDPQWLDGVGLTCVHGNPNVLTRDKGTSRLAQGCSGHLTLVEVVRFEGTLPAITVHRPPTIVPKA